jgi:hypothetical protein
MLAGTIAGEYFPGQQKKPISIMKTLTLLLSVITMTCTYVSGQTVAPQIINTTGNTFKHKQYVLEWNIGEAALVNQIQNSDSSYRVTNGFLQPFAEYLDLWNNMNPFLDGEIIILPNPTRDISEVNFKTRHKGKVKMVLYDVSGNIVSSKEFIYTGDGRIEKLNLSSYANGTYILRILMSPEQGSLPKKGTYKIFKIS